MGQTSNIGLTLLAATDKIVHLDTPFNGNMEIIDDAISRAGEKPIDVPLDTVTNTSGSYTHTTTMSTTGIVHEGMKPLALWLSNPEAFRANITITVADNAVTLTCSNVAGSSDVTVTLMSVTPSESAQPQPPSVTSTEFDILAGRIGTLSNLTTTEKSNLVGAANELNTKINTNSQAITNISVNTQHMTDGTIISNLDNIPVGTQGRVKLASPLRPNNNASLYDYNCHGEGTTRTLIVSSEYYKSIWVNYKDGSTWSGWKELALATNSTIRLADSQLSFASVKEFVNYCKGYVTNNTTRLVYLKANITSGGFFGTSGFLAIMNFTSVNYGAIFCISDNPVNGGFVNICVISGTTARISKPTVTSEDISLT